MSTMPVAVTSFDLPFSRLLARVSLCLAAMVVGLAAWPSTPWEARSDGADPAVSATQQAALATMPGAIARWHPVHAVPVSLMAPGRALSAPHTQPLDFLRDNAALFGLAGADLDSLTVVRDVTTRHNGARTVAIDQRDDGRRIMGTGMKLTLDAQGRVLLAAGLLLPGDVTTTASDQPAVAPATAAATAIAEVADAIASHIDAGPGAPTTSDDTTSTFDNPLLPRAADAEVVVELMTRPAASAAGPAGANASTSPGPASADDAARLVWGVTVPTAKGPHEVVVDASSGGVVTLVSLAQHAGPQATVFLGQDPTVSAPTTIPLVGAPHNLAGWVTGATTTGNNADAYEDANGDDVADYRPTTPPLGDPGYQHFDYPFMDAFVTSGGTDTTTDRDFTITQAFYRVNWLHDYYYALGFDEPAGNFQVDNFGRGGVGGDPMLVEVHDGTAGNSFTQSPPDGGAGRLTLITTGVDHALDMDLVSHEYTHAVTNRLVNNGTLPFGIQTWALGESWSDFFATSMWDDPVAGEYVCQNPTTGCPLYRYDASPLVYSQLCTLAGGTCEEHRDGEIFTAALWDLRQGLIDRLGHDAGRQATEQLVLDGVRATSPALATFLDARDALLAADMATTGGANECLLWGVFAGREMGVSATTSADQATVTPARDVPAPCVPTADAGGPYMVAEGDTLALDGTGSSPGSDPGVGGLSYAWDFDGDGDFDDATGAMPTFPATGDDSTTTVRLQVTNDAGITDAGSGSVTVTNVDPLAAIDTTGHLDVGGTTVVWQGPVGDATITGSATDPGSDDLTFGWDFGDGSPPLANVSLVNPPAPDPPLSPTHQPRDVTDTVTHTWPAGCLYTATLAVTDDDGGGPAVDSAVVVAAGQAATVRGSGWWKQAYAAGPPVPLSDADLDCWVEMVAALSAVWTDAGGTAPLDPVDVLTTAGSRGDARVLLDRALLTAWFNVVAGAIEVDAPVDADGDGVIDSTVVAVLVAAEQARLDPTSSRKALLGHKSVLEDLVAG